MPMTQFWLTWNSFYKRSIIKHDSPQAVISSIFSHLLAPPPLSAALPPQRVQLGGVGVLLADEQSRGLQADGVLVDPVHQLVLKLVDVPDGLEDHVQLGDARLLRDGRHEILEAVELDLGLLGGVLGDGAGVHAAEGVRRGGAGGARRFDNHGGTWGGHV